MHFMQTVRVIDGGGDHHAGPMPGFADGFQDGQAVAVGEHQIQNDEHRLIRQLGDSLGNGGDKLHLEAPPAKNGLQRQTADHVILNHQHQRAGLRALRFGLVRHRFGMRIGRLPRRGGGVL